MAPQITNERDLAVLLAFVDSRPEPGFADELTTLDQLRAFEPEAHGDTLSMAREVRDDLAAILLGPRDEAALRCTAMCDRLGVRPEVAGVGAVGWKVTRGGSLAPLLTRLVTATLELWSSGTLDSVHVCASAACIVPFVDHSPRGNRRFCSTRCATRTRVQRHRQGASSTAAAPL